MRKKEEIEARLASLNLQRESMLEQLKQMEIAAVFTPAFLPHSLSLFSLSNPPSN
jgi:hypothetical protein